MKMFRWLAAGAVVVLLAALVVWQMAPPSAVTPAPGRQPGQNLSATTSPVSAAQVSRSPEANSAPAPGTASRPAMGEFDKWVQKFVNADPAGRATLVVKGEELARVRRAEMAALIRQDPEQAMARALPYSVRKQLPENVLSLIEQPLNGRGRFRPLYYEPLPGREHETPPHGHEVTIDKKSFKTFTYGPRLTQPERENVYLWGISVHDDAENEDIAAVPPQSSRPIDDPVEIADLMKSGDVKTEAFCGVSGKPLAQSAHPVVLQFGDRYYSFCEPSHARRLNEQLDHAHGQIWASGRKTAVSVAEADGNPPDQLPPTGFSRTQGIKKLLYIRVIFADDPDIPQTEDQAQATAAANNQYFYAGSYGTVWWETTVTPIVRLPQRKNYYGENPGAFLSDAAAGAAALGYFTTDYFSPYYVLSTQIVQYDFGGLSSGILNASPGALSHELGHNFGLPHADYWQPEGRAPGPVQPPNPQPPFPIDPDSMVGHYDINGPYNVRITNDEPLDEYGNPHDVMGSGGGHFSAMFKNYMKWLPENTVRNVNVSETNRIYAFDVPRIRDGRHYALRLRKDFQQEYWVSYRQGIPSNPWFSGGVEIDWNRGVLNSGLGLSLGNNVLLDTTPDSLFGRRDGALIVGRTLNDRTGDIFITPVAMSDASDPLEKWVDVVVQRGPFIGNQLPVLSIEASSLTVTQGEFISFTATAQDPDGDQLAYHWDFGDYQFGSNDPQQSHSYLTNGQYVVRCEVSDMKGGVASAHVVVTVGAPTTFTISGRVTDIFGNPVHGVRVHNSGFRPIDVENPPGGFITHYSTNRAFTYRYGYTDSQGYYVIGNIPAGVYTNRAFIFGYRTEPLDFTDPVALTNGNANNLNFVATPITRVRIAQTIDALEPGTDGIFTITREGDLSQDLPVRFRVGGSAILDTNYTLSPVDMTYTNRVITTNDGVRETNFLVFSGLIGNFVIPAGSSTIDLHVTPINDELGDGDKTVTLSLLLRTNDFRITTTTTNILVTNGTVVVTNTEFITVTNELRIPGWELRPSGPFGTATWFQTDPTYVIDSAERTVNIIDEDPPVTPIVSVLTLDSDALESREDNATLIFVRQGAPITSDLVVSYTVFGVASNGVDFLPLPGKVTIPAGSQYALVHLTAINDLFVEADEILLVQVEPDGNGAYEPADGFGFVFIVDDDLPLVNIFASDSTATRGGGSGRVTFSRTGNVNEDLLVNYLVTGTAVSGTDFVTLPGSVIIPAGQLSADVFINALGASTNPLPRTVTIILADSTTYNIYNQNAATVTLEDGALPVLTLTTTGDTVAEASGTASFVVTRAGPTNNSLRVFFDVGGMAWEGTDYGAIGTNVLIPAGALSANITIAPINDGHREFGDVVGQETVIIQLRPGTNYLLGGANSATIRITDDDGSALPAVGFMLSGSTVREDEGSASVWVKVSANPATNRPIQVEYRVTGGSAVPDVNYINLFPEGPGVMSRTGILNITHYEPPDPPPQFFMFENGVYEVPVTILNDGVATGNRTITFTLFNPSRYQTNYSYVTNMGEVFTNVLITHLPTNAFLGPSVSHTLTIIDAGANLVSIYAATSHVYEAGAPAAFVIQREGPVNAPLTVSFAVEGTAANTNDFVLSTNRTITIPAGTNVAVLTVSPQDDPTEEMAESITVRLLPRPGYSVDFPDEATVVLVSDDGTVQFTLSSYETAEGVGTMQVPVLRSGNTNLAVAVDYRFLSGTASNGMDFLGTNGTLSFAPGETAKTIAVPIVNDLSVETDETFSLVLTNPTGGVLLGGQRTAVITILNDDAEFNFALPAFRGPENGGVAAVEIARYGATNSYETVFVSATNGTAADADFVATNVVVEFLPGVSNQTIYVAFVDDDLLEGDETIALSLSGPSGDVQLGETNEAELVIVDDECRIDFTASAYTGREYSNVVSLIVRRTGGTVNTVTVNYSTADITASNGVDYVNSSGTIVFQGDRFEADTNGTGQLSFVPGDSVQVLNIPLFDDIVGEGNETFTVTLSNPAGPSPGSFPNSTLLGSNVTARVTILDNELPGNVDYEFVSGPNAPVHAVSIAPRGGLAEFAGRVVIGGEFTQVDGIALNRIVRVLPSGLLDTAFNPGDGANGIVYAVAVQPDGKVIAGGDFTTMDNTNRGRLARLNADGHVDVGFDVGNGGVDGIVRAIAVQTNGQILIGGDFNSVNGSNRSRLARLNANGSLDTTFSVGFNGSVLAIAIQPDGKILVGGNFNQVNGNTRGAVVRLNANGSLDGTFATGSGFAGAVNALAVQSDGGIVAGGSFTGFNGNGVPYVARLSGNGALDTTFNSGGIGPNGPVNALGLAGGGKIVIGGLFTTVNGISRNYFARLTGSGSLDTTFRIGAGANALVRSLVVQPDSATVIGGDFTEVDSLPRNYIARIHGDERFEVLAVEFSSITYQIQEDGGSALITVQRFGNTNAAFNVDFTTANGSATAPGDYASTNGTLSFAPGQLSHTFQVRVFNDDLVEGNETIALLLTNAPASVDLTGISTATLIIVDSAQTISLTTNSFVVPEAASNVLITVVRGGDLSGDVSARLVTVNGLARAGRDFVGVTNIVTLTNGQASLTVPVLIIDDSDDEPSEGFIVQLTEPSTASLVEPLTVSVTITDNDLGPGFPDVAFDAGSGVSRFVRALGLQADGKLLVGGAFTDFGSSTLNYFARLQPNGSVDSTFTPGTGPNGLVSGIGVSADGHISIGGAFTNYNGAPYNRLVRLNSNGVVDAAFSAPLSFDAALNAVTVQPDGRMIVGGGFRSPVSGFARIRPNATLDLQFDPGSGTDGAVLATAVQGDGKVLIAGSFTNVAGTLHPGVARLQTNGVVDPTFNAITVSNGTVFAVAPAPGGKVVLGGSFQYINGVARRGIARLNANGSLDTSFVPLPGPNGNVYTVSVLSNGWVFIGGDFTSVNGLTQNRYSLLHDDGSVEVVFGSSIGADNVVYTSLVTPDQKFYIGGDFTTVGGLPRRGVARLNADVLRLSAPRIVSNAVQMTLNTVPGTAYVLESTTDLLYWIPLSTNVATGATLDFSDPNVSANDLRFFRARRFEP